MSFSPWLAQLDARLLQGAAQRQVIPSCPVQGALGGSPSVTVHCGQEGTHRTVRQSQALVLFLNTRCIYKYAILQILAVYGVSLISLVETGLCKQNKEAGEVAFFFFAAFFFCF